MDDFGAPMILKSNTGFSTNKSD